MDTKDCSDHPTHVIGWNGSLEELAKAIGGMTYDQTVLFIEHLAKDIDRQSVGDAARGREHLSKALKECYVHLEKAKESMDQAWKICEPYTKK